MFWFLFKAGIKAEDLIIALEPEAASIYCQHLHFEKQDLSATSLGVVKPGTDYMLVDLGGVYWLTCPTIYDHIFFLYANILLDNLLFSDQGFYEYFFIYLLDFFLNF